MKSVLYAVHFDDVGGEFGDERVCKVEREFMEMNDLNFLDEGEGAFPMPLFWQALLMTPGCM